MEPVDREEVAQLDRQRVPDDPEPEVLAEDLARLGPEVDAVPGAEQLVGVVHHEEDAPASSSAFVSAR